MLINSVLYLVNVSFFSAKLLIKRKFANHTEQLQPNITTHN